MAYLCVFDYSKSTMLRLREIKKEVIRVFSDSPDVALVDLFGSFARGTPNPSSDVDLLVFLNAGSKLSRHDIWRIWDEKTKDVSWSNQASLIIRKLNPPLEIETLLLDLPEEHVALHDPKGFFDDLKKAILAWRTKNDSRRLVSFSGKPYWLYTTHPVKLEDIDFRLELRDVA